MPTTSIIIEVDASAPTSALQGLKAEAAAIAPAVAPIQQASTRAFSQVVQDTQRARESTMLLRDEFGIAIPRALRSTIAEASLIGPLMTTAFSGLAAMAFIGIAENAGKALAGWVDGLMGWSRIAKVTMDSVAATNLALITSTEATTEKMDRLEKAYELIGLTGLPLLSKKSQQATEDFEAMKKKVVELTAASEKLNKAALDAAKAADARPISDFWGAMGRLWGAPDIPEQVTKAQADAAAGAAGAKVATDQMTALGGAAKGAVKELTITSWKDAADEIKRIADATAAATARLQEMASAANRAGLTGEAAITADALAQMNKVEEIYSKEPTLAAAAAATVTAIEAEAMRKRIALLTDEADKTLQIEHDADAKRIEEANTAAEKLRRMEDQTLSIERIAAIGIAPPWERANASIVANYQDRMARIQELIKTGDLNEQQAARRQTAAMTELFAQQRDLLATQMETLYQDVTSGNIGKAFLAMFRKMVFEMVATWILGMQGMRAVAGQAMGGGGGGILGAIFGGGGSGGGGIFGGGSSIGIGGTPPFVGGFAADGGLTGALPLGGGELAGMAPLVGIGLSAGMGGVGIGTTLPSGAGVAGTAAMGAAGLGGILTKLFPHGLSIGGTTISGTMLATLGIGLLGASFGKGGILGVLGSAAGGALTGFSIGGPIGAVIGGIVGGIVGLVSSLFGQHKGDKARIQIMEPLIAQIKILKDSYDVFQTPYNTGVSQLETLRSNAITGLKAIGGRQVSGNTASTNSLIDAAEAYLKTTEAERARRGQLAFGPAQFRSGGLVGPGSGAPVPSWFAGTAMSFGSGGAVPAFLHQGEFVMRPEAVQRYGAGNLARMNAGSGGGDIHVHGPLVHAGTVDAAWLRAGGAEKIVQEIRRLQSEGYC